MLDALELGERPELLVVAAELADGDAEFDRLRDAAAGLAPGSVGRAPMSVLTQISDTRTPQGVLAMMPQPSLALPDKPSLVLVFDRISDPGNMGTLLRSAVGAGAHVALTLPGCSDPWGLKALRSGMGAQCRVPMRQLSWGEASSLLRAWGCTAHAADARGERAHDEVDWSAPCALVVGSEAHGLSAAVRDDPSVALCRIPLGGAGGVAGDDGLESLNAAVAGSVILFEAQRQRRADSTIAR